ncbi:MAG TPA: glycosyltransferase family 2 protein [Xanthomonadales bacterium]|nr:glycosyltransferase family 2 protein [Xanthomonadales bacterium]
MSMMPRVSVIITTHARPQQVCQAVKSALAQTLQDIEVIVVLDGPDPMTLANLESITDPRLRIHVRGDRGGQGAAINSGIELVSGTWTALMDDDDVWMPEKLETQLRIAESSTSASPVVGCHFLARSDAGDLLWPLRSPRPDERICDYLFCRNRLNFGEGILPTSVLFAPTELFRLVSMDETLHKYADIDWLIRADQRPEVQLMMPALRKPLAIWQQQGMDRMSKQHDWRQSCQWISGHRKTVTARAYAGFLLTWVSFNARSQGDLSAIPFLLKEAFQHGRPSLVELAVYAAVWCLPLHTRQRWSAWMTNYQQSGGPQ